MSDSYEKATPMCDCHVHGVTGIDALVELINRGMGQWQASLALWATGQQTTAAAEVPA